MEMLVVAKTRLRNLEKWWKCHSYHPNDSSVWESTLQKEHYSMALPEPERRYVPEQSPTERTPPLSESLVPNWYKSTLVKVQEWFESCSRWPERRRLALSSSMKLMLLVAPDSTMVLAATTRSREPCWNSLPSLTDSTQEEISRS